MPGDIEIRVPRMWIDSSGTPNVAPWKGKLSSLEIKCRFVKSKFEYIVLLIFLNASLI